MLNRNKTYRVLIAGYWAKEEERGHFSAIMKLPYDRMNTKRKTALERQLKNLKLVDHVAITSFEVQ